MTEPITATALSAPELPSQTQSQSQPPPQPLPFQPSDLVGSATGGHDSTHSLPSPQIAIHEAFTMPVAQRPSLASHTYQSAPAVQQFQSPLRQHKRTPSQHREVKETLNARSEYMSDDTEGTKHIINQYIIKEEIGRGSYGAVHLATDQFGNEYAVKEFSKTRLRKRAQSNILKRPQGAKPGRFPPGRGMRASWSQHMRALSNHDAAEAKDSLFLIREEIAIMKKLNHPNLVSLIEVLDDPEEDSLYMVLEMCKKGVIMKVGLDDQADPYPEESCRHWFRDLILGIEYLHAQGVVHRDIKPDNLLLTQDDVLKIVDFGVSEMFEKPEDMKTAKSAGSPAFLPPELCRSKHGDISGKAADIWSMGVSLYCLKYGRLPFRRINVLEMYEAIRTEGLELPPDENRDFVDLISRLLDKNAETRIGMREIRNHSWVTKGGSDPLLSEEENCENMVEPPNELEVNHAFTRKMSHMLVVMVAIHKFKALINKSRVGTPEARTPRKSKTLDVPIHALEAPEPAVRPINTEELPSRPPPPHKATAEEAAELIEARKAYHAATTDARNPPALDTSGKGQAHDPTSAEPRFLGIGTGVSDEFATSESPADVVSDSPTGIDFDVYDRAFSDEVERIRSSSEKQGRRRTTYLTKFVSEKEKYFGDECMVMEAGRSIPSLVANTRGKASSAAAKTWSHIALGYGKEGSTATTSDATGEQEPSRPGLWKGKAETKRNETQEFIRETGHRFADLVSATMHGTKAKSGGGESS